MQRLHESEVLAQYGEFAEAYVRSQVMTKAFEAIGVSALSVCYRDIDGSGTVLDFDGQPMRDKLAAARQLTLPAFEADRRAIDERNFARIEHWAGAGLLDQLSVLEISSHPDVEDEQAAAMGYSPTDRFVIFRRYSLENELLVLRSYNLPGSDLNRLLRLHSRYGGQLSDGANEADLLGDLLLTEDRLEHILGNYEPAVDFSDIEKIGRWLEIEARPLIDKFIGVIREIGDGLSGGLIGRTEAGWRIDQYERGLLTLLMVKFNPERAARQISAEDLLWAQLLLEQEDEEVLLAAAAIANRNGLDFIACGGELAALLGEKQEWYGAFKTIGNCVNCGEGPKEVGEKGWCQPCIGGHCGKK